MKDDIKFPTFNELCERVLALWPAEIAIDERIESDERIKTGEGGVRYPSLIDAHNRVELTVLELGNPLFGVMDWTIYKTLHACAAFQNVVRPNELSRAHLKRTFEYDLSITPELSDERRRYNNAMAS